MRILFLQKRLLFPTDTGGAIRTLNVLRHLAQWHDVTYLSNVQAKDEVATREMRKLGLKVVGVPWRETPRGSTRFYGQLLGNLLSGFPFNVNKDYDPRLRRRANELLRDEPFDLVICDFVQMARNVIRLPGPPKLLFQHNVEAEIFQRHATNGGAWLRRKYMGLQWRKMRRFEAEAGRQFDSVVAVSERDKQIFERDYGWRHVHTIDTAVDTEYYQPRPAAERPDRVVFVGSMDWLPNADGVKRFVREIWLQIREARPAATFQIVGRSPDASVRRLAAVEGVEVTGSVPDVRPHLAEAALVVVPLYVGGGTRLKIFEAMAMEKAVVSTSLGAEGLELTPGVHIELAHDDLAFAGRVVELLADREKRSRLAKTAHEHVCRRFSAEQVARQFERICLETAGSWPAGESARRQPVPM